MREPKSNLLPLLFPNVFSLILYYSLFLVLSCQKLIYFPECLVNGFPSADVFLLPNRCQTSNGREWRRRLVRKLKGSKELFITRKWGEKEMRFKGNDSPPCCHTLVSSFRQCYSLIRNICLFRFMKVFLE